MIDRSTETQAERAERYHRMIEDGIRRKNNYWKKEHERKRQLGLEDIKVDNIIYNKFRSLGKSTDSDEEIMSKIINHMSRSDSFWKCTKK